MFEANFLNLIDDTYKLKIVLILTVGFGLASILGYFSQKFRISPILGYLVAGYMIGPYSPGLVVDLEISEQLAEIGVILMMFGVGLHFRWEDLVNVKGIAIPGAALQTLSTTLVGALLLYYAGFSLDIGIVMGVALGVASTVVLVRVLNDNNLLHTIEGHIAVGWLIVEDILTVFVLILLPTLAAVFKGNEVGWGEIANSTAIVLFKFFLLGLIVFSVGIKFVKYTLFKVARTRSNELLTLSVLALTFFIATSSAVFFGVSIALGAFIAGMVVGQTEVRHQAMANSLPMQDAFVVFFFLSVGMLFNPFGIFDHIYLFLAILGIILIFKPLIAFIITKYLNYSFRTSLTVAIGLAQIGEFSFILAEEAMKNEILPEAGYDIIVACALVSLSLNPLLFRLIDPLTRLLEKKSAQPLASQGKNEDILNPVLIVGYGPIGQGIARTIKDLQMTPIIVDRNIDTIETLRKQKLPAVYGDASHFNILENAHVKTARLLVITAPDVTTTLNIVKTALALNPKIQILARASYITGEKTLRDLNIYTVCSEKETLKACNKMLLRILRW